MPSQADILGLQAVTSGHLIVKADEGEIWTPTGKRAEIVDKRTAYGRVRVYNRPIRLAMAHRVIWMSAHGLIPDGLQINHVNRVRWDNRIINLELVTPAGNVRHAHGHGYDAIGGNVDVGWLERMDRGVEDSSDDDEDVDRLMREIPGPRQTPRAHVSSEIRWDRFR